MMGLATSIALSAAQYHSNRKSGGKDPPKTHDHLMATLSGMKWITWHGRHFLVPIESKDGKKKK